MTQATKPKRVLTPAQHAALVKNAAKGRRKLAQMRKLGLTVGKPKKNKSVDIPLAMIPASAVPVPVAKYKAKPKNPEYANVNALAQLIVATWEELVKRRGAV